MKRNCVVFVRFALALAFITFSAAALWAQGTGALTGRVTDPSGAVIPNANVTLTNSATGQTLTTVTTDAGIYNFPALTVVGTYILKVEVQGFKIFQAGNVVVSVGRTVVQDARLEIGTPTQSVTVEAGVQLVQPTESQISGLLNQRDWQSLPLEVRSQNAFIENLAGVVPDAFAGTGRGASVEGARTGTGNFMVQGFNNNDQGLGGGGALVGPGGSNTTISPDAIQEYRVIEHLPPAEYGKTGGFATDTVLKSGTNSWHGSLFEYNRVQALAANHFFSNVSGVQDSLVRNQFGGSVGGPIIKNKTFFYFTTELNRERTATPVTTTSTTSDFLNFVNSGKFATFMESAPAGLCVQATGAACPGAFSKSATLGPIFSNLKATQPFPLATRNFSPCGASLITGQSAFKPTVQCNGGDPTLKTPASLTFPVNVYGQVTVSDHSQTNQTRYSANVDHTLSARDKLHGVFLYDNADAFDQINGSDTTLGVPLPNHGRAMNAGIDWDHTFSPTILNQARVGYVRHTGDFPGDPKAAAAGLPSIITFIDPLGVGFGNASNLPQFFTENEFQYKDDLSFTKGKHNFKTGAEYSRTRNFSSFQADFNGFFGPYGVEDLVTDMNFGDEADAAGVSANVIGTNVGSWFEAEASVNPVNGQRPVYNRGFRANELGAYFQDDWRMLPRLTWNLGLRWDYFGPPHNNIPGIDSNFYFGTPVTPIQTTSKNPFFPRNNPIYAQVATGTLQVRNHEVWNKDTDNWAPRIGFAWDTTGTQKFIVRGGYGIGFDRMYNNIFENIRFNPPFFCFCNFGAFLNGVPGGAISTPGIYTVPFTSTSAFVNPKILPVLPKASPRHMDQNLETQYYQQFALSTQYAFSHDWVFEADYTRTLGRKLLGVININTFDGRTVPGLGSRRPNPNINSDNFRTNAFSSNYNGLQASLRHSFASGLQLNMNYTYSKSLDDLSDVFSNKTGLNPTDNMNINTDYGPADFDLRHRFVTSFHYELPFLKANEFLGGWSLSGIVSLQSGTPFSVIDGGHDTNRDGEFTDRVSYVGSGPITNAIVGSGSPADGYLKPSAGVFADTVCPATVNGGKWCDGGSGRNALYGPGFKNVDFRVAKQFKIYERLSATFQASFFNLFNHSNFRNPVSDINNPGQFGLSLSTHEPRITQLALRLDF